MNTYEYKEAVENALNNRNFHETFRLLRVMLSADNWRQRADIEGAEEDYSRIVDYALSGAPDPSREAQISALITRIYSILDLLLRESLIAEHNSLYFSVARTLRLRRNETLVTVIEEYVAASRSLAKLTGSTDAERRQAEDLEERLFERIWTTVPLSFDECSAIRKFMSDDLVSQTVKAMTVGALTMSLLQFYSEPTLRLLLELAKPESDSEIRIRATVGAVLVMARWPQRSNTVAVNRQLDTLREVSTWQRDVEQTIMSIIRAADVEKLSKTLRDEIIPEMMKLRPDIERHIKESGFDPAEMEMNPEWEEMLEKSGLNEKMRKLQEMQEDGGDLFYPMFQMLKSFPFFNHISHWFLPFTTSRRDVRDALGHDAALEVMLEQSPMMCASDKYSFALSVTRIPEAQKQMLMTQLSEAAAMPIANEQRPAKDVIRAYIHDLYRFFNLFRRSGEFVNPFKSPINPAEIPALAADFNEQDKLRLLGEFYFKHGQFDQALTLFRTVSSPDLALHQKMGHALQRLGLLEDAIKEYEHAELLAPESEWTLTRLARLNKHLGRHQKALEYYNKIEVIAPDKPATALAMGHCFLELNELRESLHYFYKAEMLDEKSTKALRPIAWVSFLNKDYDTAQQYLTRILSELTPEPADYLNMGHLALVQGNIREAVNYYSLSTPELSKLDQMIAEDMPLLRQSGIDVSLIPLILDTIRYKNDSK
ncbi:MAG: hypothetical protein NC301_06960 [Bacteroides sp.]|nr:hypothetical protein [Bacteroides sp.]MCM1379938.1 hypothetical protein [Bacteroides sp.]MCM1446207.1 hypothetical protein [Prevotella sp.]